MLLLVQGDAEGQQRRHRQLQHDGCIPGVAGACLGIGGVGVAGTGDVNPDLQKSRFPLPAAILRLAHPRRLYH